MAYKYGKGAMSMIQKQKKIWISVCLLLILLCGCEKKEEVVLSLGDGTMDVSQEKEEIHAQNEIVPEEVTVDDSIADSIADDPALNETTAEDVVYVHICGAVVTPGVYQVKRGSRIYEAIDLADGFGL